MKRFCAMAQENEMFNNHRGVGTMKKSTLLIVAILTVFFAAGALSQTRTPRVDARERHQQKRIEQGVKSGELTKGEVHRLERQEGRIKASEAIAKADGKVTPRERAKLNHQLNRESKRIYRAKHNKIAKP